MKHGDPEKHRKESAKPFEPEGEPQRPGVSKSTESPGPVGKFPKAGSLPKTAYSLAKAKGGPDLKKPYTPPSARKLPVGDDG